MRRRNFAALAEPPPMERVEAPEEFQEGFTLRTVIGALFIALFMLPGGMYLGLVAGQGVGEAAEWVTIVLFAEPFGPWRRTSRFARPSRTKFETLR